MPAFVGNKKTEHFEWISSTDLIDAAHLVMEGIDLDPASSEKANEYVNAKNFYTVKEDGLNEMAWFGNVYLFPPRNSYFWHKKSQRWRTTRGLSPSLTSGQALWWRTLKRKWLDREVEQAIFFSNSPDMCMYCQDIFDHPICFLRTRPQLIQHFIATDELKTRNTCASFVVFLQPSKDVEEATEKFIEIYSPKGRVVAG